MASFLDFAEVAQTLSQTHSRLQIAQTAGDFLAGLDPHEVETCARFLIGRALAQGERAKLNISGRAVWRSAAEITGGEESGEEIFASAVDFGEAIEILMRSRRDRPAPSLTIGGVARAFAEIAATQGRNARKRKLDVLRELLTQATALEAKYLAKILIGEMRHGMSEGLMIEALARMASAPVPEVRRMHMLEGDLGRVAARLRGVAPGESAAAAAIRPLKPMLAQPADEVADAFAILGREFALEHKLDGARVQIHRAGGDTRIFSRRLNEITPSLPEVVEAMQRLGDRDAILDGEVIAVDAEGRPRAFQELMRRFRRIREIDRLRAEQPIRLFVFDLIGLDGHLLIDETYQTRTQALAELGASAGLEMPQRLVTSSLADAEQFFADAIAAGHEGVMAKALESRYTSGARGRGWLKIKHVQTLDLVIVAADWGYGRRHGWLSNYHLAAREARSGRLLEVGKTFKGLTDDQFREMTQRMLALKTGEHAGTVEVRPEVVVEVAYSDIQRSPRYESAMALRFARIVRLREDKTPEEADSLETMTREFERQTIKPRSRADKL